ncbi:TPA: hypothetical protein DCX16_00040 [bacterium]|nr:hypothetical protein [bacterium]
MQEKTREQEEALGIIWHFRERKIKDFDRIIGKLKEISPGICDCLVEKGFIEIKDKTIELTPSGEKIAYNITRRHRLAERLLHDVLEINKEEIDQSACEFEHILSDEVTDSICTLLGHPKFCPHNSPIPAGECCTKAKEELESIVVSLDKLKSGDTARIAYISILEHQRLHKLLSLGIIPGKILHLHQTEPAFVIKVDETQIALDKDFAKNIYLRRST